MAMKEQAGMSSRCIPYAQEHLDDCCAVCGKPADKMIIWGVAY
jgi:prolyl-tRNA synthetase